MQNEHLTKQLVEQLRNNDFQAFESLYHLYHKRIYAFALKLLNSPSDAEDIVQNVFLAIWNQRQSLNVSTTFTSYLFGISRHIIYSLIQQRINRDAFAEYFVERNEEYSFVTEETIAYNELERKLDYYISMLPERRREIFLLSRIEKLSYKEIATRLDISENTVDTQIRLALNFLRKQLSEYFSLLLFIYLVR